MLSFPFSVVENSKILKFMCSKQSWEIDTDMNVGVGSCEWRDPHPDSRKRMVVFISKTTNRGQEMSRRVTALDVESILMGLHTMKLYSEREN